VVDSVYSAVRTDSLYKADLLPWWIVFTARYGLIPYIKQIYYRGGKFTARYGLIPYIKPIMFSLKSLNNQHWHGKYQNLTHFRDFILKLRKVASIQILYLGGKYAWVIKENVSDLQAVHTRFLRLPHCWENFNMKSSNKHSWQRKISSSKLGTTCTWNPKTTGSPESHTNSEQDIGKSRIGFM
jgi:hypothetical protein